MEPGFRPPRSGRSTGAHRHTPAQAVGIDRFRRLLNAKREEVTTPVPTRRPGEEEGVEPAALFESGSIGESSDGANAMASVLARDGGTPPQTNAQSDRQNSQNPQNSQGDRGGDRGADQGQKGSDGREQINPFGANAACDVRLPGLSLPGAISAAGGDAPRAARGSNSPSEAAGTDGASRRAGAADERSLQRRGGAQAQHGNGGSSGDQRGDEGGWCRETASLIGRLCATSGEFECWSATLPIDEAVLPDTVLRMELSPHWLSLRFTTQSAYSARLISSDRERLQRLLEATPGLPRGIGIELA